MIQFRTKQSWCRLGLGWMFASLLMVQVGCPGSKPVDPKSPGTTSSTATNPDPEDPSRAAWFRDHRAKMGVDFVYHSGHQTDYLFPEIVGGGGALFDMDNDGDLDLYLVDGGNLNRNSQSTARNKLYRNDQGKFVDISSGSGADDDGYGMGVAAGDFDNDGYIDLFVTNVGKNCLLRNQGNGTFVDVTEPAGVGDTGWGTSTAFFHANDDEFLDLYVCRYVDWSLDGDVKCFKPSGVPDYCSPKSFDRPTVDRLYLNQGNGTFVDVTEASGITAAKGNGLGVVPADFNSDGFMDLFVANDMTNNLLWLNDGTGKFTNQAMMAGCAVDRDGQAKAGMGTCTADLNGDDHIDIMVVNLASQSDSFFENRGGFFVDQTPQKNLALDSRPFTRFGVGLHDFDHDGHLDAFFANGRVTLPDTLPSGDPFAEANLLLRGNEKATFSRVKDQEAGDVALPGTSRAAIFGDINNDGWTDVVVVNKDGQVHILINEYQKRFEAGKTSGVAGSETTNWIGFDVRTAKGTLAHGAIVRTQWNGKPVRRDVNPHYSFLASNDHRVHFGLAATGQLEQVEVQWRSGKRERFGPFAANQYHRIVEGGGTTQ